VVVSVPSRARVFLARHATDMRKSFDGLCNLVEHSFHLDPFSDAVFVFFNRRRTHVKLLVWDDNGFWLCAKRLERGTFEHWQPQPDDATHVEIDRARMLMLLEGIALKNAKFRRHFARSLRIGSSSGGHQEDDGRSREAR
jgi:transposase